MNPWLRILVLIVVVAGCKTPQPVADPPLMTPTDAPDVPPSLAAANSSLRDHLRKTQLSVLPEEGQAADDVLTAMIRWKSNRMGQAIAPFEAALTRRVDPDVEEFALLRLAVAEMNYACEVTALPPPAFLDESQRLIVSDVLDRTAFETLAHAREYLKSAEALQGRRRETVTSVLEKLPTHDGEVDAACVATRTFWTAPDATSLSEVSRTGCEDNEGAFCWIWSIWAEGEERGLARACELDFAAGCLGQADRLVVHMTPQSSSADDRTAEGLYRKACRLGAMDGCRKEFAVFVPADVDEYRSACLTEDDAVACVKHTRALGVAQPDSKLWWACTATSEDRKASPPATCDTGDAFACAARAGSLKVSPSYVIQIPDPPASDVHAAALACGEGDQNACRAGARAFAQAGNWGCAVALTVEACGRGATDLCAFVEPL